LAKSRAIPFAGRALVRVRSSYALPITDLDPIRFAFCSSASTQPIAGRCDFDIDFCQERRGDLIESVQRRYGRDQVGDHHVRHAARRAACCSTSGACWKCLQVDSSPSGA